MNRFIGRGSSDMTSRYSTGACLSSSPARECCANERTRAIVIFGRRNFSGNIPRGRTRAPKKRKRIGRPQFLVSFDTHGERSTWNFILALCENNDGYIATSRAYLREARERLILY